MPIPNRETLKIRPAQAEDADTISSLYREAYTPPGKSESEAREHYPFPQFLNPAWVTDAVCQDKIRWLVAEYMGEVIGTVGAVINIGSKDDRVAESFGLVIKEQLRGLGIGTYLFRSLCDNLADNAKFIIAETRTAHPGGWKIVRSCGFVPLGFEPYAHATPAGIESMLLTGRLTRKGALERDTSGTALNSLQVLANTVLRPLNLQPLSMTVQADDLFYAMAQDEHRITPLVQLPQKAKKLFSKEENQRFSVARDDRTGANFLKLMNVENRHAVGVIGLRRLEGEDLRCDRYDRQYIVGTTGQTPVACAHLLFDRRDGRLRVLELQSLVHGHQYSLIEHIVSETECATAGKPLSMVVDVRADNPGFQAVLERLSFFPTAYYPGLVMVGSQRIDAVQYTRLFNLSLADSIKHVKDLNWPQAEQVLFTVSRQRKP
jgi:RimJ/RimL family protein N-acetyltransferase